MPSLNTFCVFVSNSMHLLVKWRERIMVAQQLEDQCCFALIPFPAKPSSPQHGFPYHAMTWVWFESIPQGSYLKLSLLWSSAEDGQFMRALPWDSQMLVTDAGLTERTHYSRMNELVSSLTSWIPLHPASSLDMWCHPLPPWRHSSRDSSQGDPHQRLDQ